MADKRVKKKSADKKPNTIYNSRNSKAKPNTQAIRRKKYNTILNSMQVDSQCYDILKLLIRKGSTTSKEIESELDIVNPQARISELRDPRRWDLPITKEMISRKNKRGKSVRYGKYTLEV